jgi:hypothetical protein
LNALAALDMRQSQVVELRFFGGLSLEETAEALKTFRRDSPAGLDIGPCLASSRIEPAKQQ